MARLIFVNKNAYDIFVPTPNGAGRRVPVGKAVEGDYFIDLANTGQLQRFIGDPSTVDIICNYQLNSYLKASQASQAELKAATAAEKAAEVLQAALPVEEELPVVEALVEESATPLTPTEKDLFKLSMEELRMVAAAQGIDAAENLKKKTLIKMINSKK